MADHLASQEASLPLSKQSSCDVRRRSLDEVVGEFVRLKKRLDFSAEGIIVGALTSEEGRAMPRFMLKGGMKHLFDLFPLFGRHENCQSSSSEMLALTLMR
jgi:hypothetical protein